jgi:hypothetical protein
VSSYRFLGDTKEDAASAYDQNSFSVIKPGCSADVLQLSNCERKHFNYDDVHRPERIKETSPGGCWFIYGEDGCRGEALGG